MSEITQQKKPNKKRKGWSGWLKEIAIFCVIALVVGWGADIWRSQTSVSGKAPTLISQSVTGDEINLFTMSQEKPVLLYFWATWCAVCNSVSPSVNFVSEHYQVVTVALTSGEDKRVKQYLKSKDYNFNVVNDPKGDITRAWGVSVTPTIFVIDKGEITSFTTGFTSPMGMWFRLIFA